MAEPYHVAVAPHCYNGPIGLAANVQLAATLPNLLIVEGIQDWSGFHAELLTTPIQWEDGFVIPAGGDRVLEPGNDHVMVMEMSDPVEPGEDVEITLTLDDGTTYTYTAQGREAEVGDEEYVPSEDTEMDMESDDMSDDS